MGQREQMVNQAKKTVTREYNDITNQRPLENILDPMEENAEAREEQQQQQQNNGGGFLRRVLQTVNKAVDTAVKTATKEYKDITDQRPLEGVRDNMEDNAQDRQQEKMV